MLRLALLFFVISLVAAVFAFTGIAAAAAESARLLFLVALVIFRVLLMAGLMAGSALFQGGHGFCAAHTRIFVRCTPDICACRWHRRIMTTM